MSHDGSDEADWILDSETGIGGLYGGRVWESGVPRGLTLPKDDSGVLPYITIHFGVPVAMPRAQAIAGGVRSAPHLFGFAVHVHASTVDDLKAATKAVVGKLEGAEPSTTGNAGEITLNGGHTFDTQDNSGEQTRYMRMIHFAVVIGFAGE